MANRKFLVDIDLNQNQLLNGVIHNVTVTTVPSTADGKWEISGISNPKDGQLVYGSYSNSGTIRKELLVYKDFGASDTRNGWYAAGSNYVLPVATASVLGGVKIGDNINVTSQGTISVNTATMQQKGVVQGGANVTISDGIISVPDGDASQKGVVQLSNSSTEITSSTLATTPAAVQGIVETAVTNTLDGLDGGAQIVQISSNAGSVTASFYGVKEVNGIVSTGSVQEAITIGRGNLKIAGYGTQGTGSDFDPEGGDIFGANYNEDSTLTFDKSIKINASSKTFGVRTNKPVSVTNPVATMQDIESLDGAMHYIGCADTAAELATLQAGTHHNGDTIVIGTAFDSYQAGDTLIYNEEGQGRWDVIQGNIDLGMGAGQVATNQTVLETGKIVVAGSTGVQTTGVEITTTTISGSANNDTTIPTTKSVYDYVQGLANVWSVSEATTVTKPTAGIACVQDVMTVNGNGQTGQYFQIVQGAGIEVDVTNHDITIKNTATTSKLHDTFETATSTSGGVYTYNIAKPATATAGAIASVKDNNGEEVYVNFTETSSNYIFVANADLSGYSYTIIW